MTTPDERTRTVVRTHSFLQRLTWASTTPGVPEAIREEARRLLRHYPGRSELSLAHAALPRWFGELPSGEET